MLITKIGAVSLHIFSYTTGFDNITFEKVSIVSRSTVICFWIQNSVKYVWPIKVFSKTLIFRFWIPNPCTEIFKVLPAQFYLGMWSPYSIGIYSKSLESRFR
jgi:hypothetical protein